MVIDPHTQFQNFRSRIAAEAFERMAYRKQHDYVKDLSFFSANIQNFLPEIPTQEHEEAYVRHTIFRGYANMDLYFGMWRDGFDAQLTGHYQSILNDSQTGYIFCTFHLGPYRLLLRQLQKAGREISLIVDERTQNELLEKQQNEWSPYLESGLGFEILNAERFEVMIQLFQRLREGRSMVAYLDGNTGTGGVYRQDDKLTDISFLNGSLRARVGISHIAYASRAPIVPVVAYYDEQQNPVLHFDEPIYPDRQVKADAFAKTTTQRLYDIFAPFLREHYEQWESWSYVHKYVPANAFGLAYPEPSQASAYTFNAVDYSLFKMSADSHFLLDKRNYQTYELTPRLYQLLRDSQHQPLPHEKLVSVADSANLLRKHMLIGVSV